MAKMHVNITQTKRLIKAMKNKPKESLREIAEKLDIDYSIAEKIYNERINDKKQSKVLQSFKRKSVSTRKRTLKQPKKSQEENQEERRISAESPASHQSVDQQLGYETRPQLLPQLFHLNQNLAVQNATDVSLFNLTTAHLCKKQELILGHYISQLDKTLIMVEMQRRSIREMRRNLVADLENINRRIREEQGSADETAAHYCRCGCEGGHSSEQH